MIWKKSTSGSTKFPDANRRLFAPGAATLLRASLVRLAEIETIDDMETILFHAIEGSFLDQKRAKEYIDTFNDKIWEEDRDYESCEQLLTTLFRSLLDQLEAVEMELHPKSINPTGRVFVVHGRDLGIRDVVCRHLRGWALTPVVLADTAGSSQAIIELVEKHGRVDHAVCLLTADDVGGVRDGSLRPRARQNVIWEVGYFFGLLGRDRVSIIADEELELPSNILGLRPIVLSPAVNLGERLHADLKLAGTLRK